MYEFPTRQTCELCGNKTLIRVCIDKQTSHGYARFMVCEACAKDHENYLESLRKNFRVQFGEK